MPFPPYSPTPAHSWLEGGSSTPLSHYTPQPSPPLTLAAPNSHSSPRGAPRSLSSSLDVGGLENSLLEAVEGLEALGLDMDVAQPPLLPLKRRGTEGSETMFSFPLNRSGISGSYASHNTSPTRSTPSPGWKCLCLHVCMQPEIPSTTSRMMLLFRFHGQ